MKICSDCKFYVYMKNRDVIGEKYLPYCYIQDVFLQEPRFECRFFDETTHPLSQKKPIKMKYPSLTLEEIEELEDMEENGVD